MSSVPERSAASRANVLTNSSYVVDDRVLGERSIALPRSCRGTLRPSPICYDGARAGDRRVGAIPVSTGAGSEAGASMGPRWGFGPVFANEWLTTSRRWQVYAGRALFVGVLLVGLWSVWVSRTSGQTVPTIHLWAEIGEGFFNAIVFTQLSLVLLAAPAATAGTICQDRSSGRLAQLLATDLSDAEIVLGKLGARLVPVVGLVACALPALAICVLMGGVDPLALAGAFLITVCLGIFGCALALAFSVWAAKPYEAILATYAFFMVWLLAIPTWDNLGRHWGFPTSPDWLIWSHPFYLAFAPYVQPGKVGVLDYLAFGAAMLISSSALLALVIGRMRAVIAAEGDRSASRLAVRGVLGMSIVSQRTGGRSDRMLDQSPVLWYETQRKQYTPWIRAVLGLYFLLAILFTVLALLDSLWIGRINRGWLPGQVAAFLVACGLPLLLVSATMAVVEERGRGSLDILLVTPVATRSIVLAKWWGAFRELPRVLVLPLLVAGVDAWINDTWPLLALLVAFICADAAFWTSVGLALSTWIARLGLRFRRGGGCLRRGRPRLARAGPHALRRTARSGPGGYQPLPRVVYPDCQSRVSEIHR